MDSQDIVGPGSLPEIRQDRRSITFIFNVDRRKARTATLQIRCCDDGAIYVGLRGIVEPRKGDGEL